MTPAAGSRSRSLVAAGHKPQRTCLGCRETFDQHRLIRFVPAPDGTLLVDYRRKLPGRGAYVCARRQCLLQAAAKGGFSRSFKRELRVDGQQLLARVADQQRQTIDNLIGMARKAGQGVGGSNLVLGELQRGSDIALVLLAKDVSAGIGNKVCLAAGNRPVRQPDWLDKSRLGVLCGRAERSVLALRSGPIAEKLLYEFSRYDQIAGDC
ncbi:DUF448 domain-containing protein [Geothermobacter hydrogeniphilus]|uniref:DUF448 domain-containing protein n=1 Tax=Geothermobacter hydrogeniphilus TaxID=1969733 RepID=A0A2K2HD17_9BACT|nr:DUF448 domain-containing protein [Geothermobacter hydrogeniphilus]